MKVLIINGSPHKNGCTERALKEYSLPLKENEFTNMLYSKKNN